MGLRRYANKRDENEGAIIAALEAMGCLVMRLDKPVDLLVLLPVGRGIVLVEVKTKRGTLTRDQLDFAEYWPFHVLRSPDDAIAMVQTARRVA